MQAWEVHILRHSNIIDKKVTDKTDFHTFLAGKKNESQTALWKSKTARCATTTTEIRLQDLQNSYKVLQESWFWQAVHLSSPLTVHSAFNKNYYTLNSLTLFWLANSIQWIFEISAHDVITADYTIIMSTTLKVMGYHVMCDFRAWFLRVIMSTSCNSCYLPSEKKQKHDSQVFVFSV